MTIGVMLLLYVAAQYGIMLREQHRLAREWQEQQQSSAATSTAMPVARALTRLSIPKINLDAVVVDGTSRKQLLIGPGHVSSTAWPGEPGNAVITAHRDTFFRHIYELDRGDVIELRRGGNTYKYAVTGKRVVDPDDVSVLKPTRDPELTLITCYPTYYIGPAPERLVVHSRLVNDGARASDVRGDGNP
ncbi:MAG TPA: class D sortase [Terriglobales bacterium]|nr:class D sortase [Terriglobales bacterium]